MPSFKSFWSSLGYHAVTRPAITAAKKFASNLTNTYKRRRMIRRGIDPDWQKKLRMRTRGRHDWNNERKYSKFTMAGQKRRNELASKLKATRALTRGHHAPGMGPAPSGAQKKAIAQRTAYRQKQGNFRANLRKQTRGPQAGNKRLWDRSKGYSSVLKRREEAVKKFKASSAWRLRPQRRRTGDLSKVKGIVLPPKRKPPTAAQRAVVRATPKGSVAAATHSSQNYGQLRRKLAAQSVRSVIRKFGTQGSVTSRKVKADTIRALRKNKVYRQHLRTMVKDEKGKRMAHAAKLLASRP